MHISMFSFVTGIASQGSILFVSCAILLFTPLIFEKFLIPFIFVSVYLCVHPCNPVTIEATLSPTEHAGLDIHSVS